MKKEDCYSLGKVTQPHGVKGEVKLWLDVDEVDYYADLDSVLLDLKGQLVPFFIEEITIRDKKSIARFEGMKTWEDTQEVIGCDMYLPLSRLPKLADDQYYYHEIIGYDILDNETKSVYGKVDSVVEGSGQDLLTMMIGDKEVLIPVTDGIILKVYKIEKQLFVDLPTGLIELYTEDQKKQDDQN
ncbi:MAG: ribosome maturation factor RimM [Spirosomaceae bacterium]|nr:ribosome maturation factor RimM [Spirosomataceae bacterium]